MTNKITGVSLISFLSAMAGIVISFLLLKEDVISTAKTVFEYFPQRYGVTPSTSWDGAIILGVFISVLQIVSASVAFAKRFSMPWRLLAWVSLICSVYFDNWTDIIFRSGYGLGDKQIATITTLAFYTFGSEITQSLSWLVFMSLWRAAISDIMIGFTRFNQGLNSIGAEWRSLNKGSNPPPHQDNRPKHLEQNQNRPVASLQQNRYQRPNNIFTINKTKSK